MARLRRAQPCRDLRHRHGLPGQRMGAVGKEMDLAVGDLAVTARRIVQVIVLDHEVRRDRGVIGIGRDLVADEKEVHPAARRTPEADAGGEGLELHVAPPCGHAQHSSPRRSVESAV